MIAPKKMTWGVLLVGTFMFLIPKSFAENEEPTIPNQITKFQATVQINQPAQGYSSGVKEFYDAGNKRSAIFVTEMGRTTIIIHNHKSGEILTVSESPLQNIPVYKCKVDEFSQEVLLSSYINPSWLLREATKSREIYIPKAKPIRGIPVNHWTANLSLTDANFTVDYFYSEPSWINKNNLNEVPVRVKISGPFNIVYDYYDFLNTIEDPSVFQTPEGVYCPNRKTSKSIPMISNQVSYRVEFNSKESQAIFSMDIWVDSRNHFVRIDYGKELNPDDNQLLSEVHDFNLDVNYKIDRTSGKCQSLQLSTTDRLEIDISKKMSKSGCQTISMKHPYEMFYFDHDFQYTGQRYFNGILCDIFITQVLNYKVSGIPFNVTMEYYFTADNWKEVSNKALDTETNVPVLLQIKSFDMSFIETYRYLDFDQGSLYLSAFDVTQCFKQDEKVDFQVDFTRPREFDMKTKDDIREILHMKLAMVSSITPLRIEKAKLHIQNNYIQFVATLVGLPPAFTQFGLDYDCIQLTKNDKLLVSVPTPEDCASICQNEESFVCNAFVFCEGKKFCSLSEKVIGNGTKISGSSCCKHFKRLVNQKKEWITIGKAWTKLKDAVFRGKVFIPMPPITAVDIKQNVLNGANREIGSVKWQKEFSRLKNHVIEGHDSLLLSGIGVDDCASACFVEENFVCLSFDFCYSNGECRLSKETAVMNPQYLKPSSTCDVYNVNFINWFNEFPGETILPKLDFVYQRVGTAEQCANLCVNNAEFLCKSFDYCELIQTCVISKTHIYDVPRSQVNLEPMCSHYSMKYLTDFKKTANKFLKLDDDEIIADISEEHCAKICAENEKFLCKSFDYCTDSEICLYRSKHYKDAPQGKGGLQASIYCNHYARMYLPDGTMFSPTFQNYLSPAKKGYSSASMGLLAFFMMVIGVCGALLAKLIHKKYLRKRRDSLSENIMKNCSSPIY